MSTDVQNAIFASAKAGYDDDIKELLANPKVDWTAKDGLGNTPLHYAAGAGHPEVVKLLLNSKKIDINAQNHSGDTAAHKAAGKGHIAVCKLLVAAGINLTLKNTDHKWAKDLAHNGELKTVLEPVVEIPGLGSDDEEEDNKDDEEEDEDEDDG